jgi:hypothetical protein
VKVDGQELLGSSTIHPKYYGSSLWLSPEGKWKGGGVLDTAAYSVGTANSRQMSFTSQDDTLRGFNMKKEFRVSMPDTSVIVSYTLKNIRASQQDVAPWEVTRVPSKGLAFFPAGSLPPLPKSNLAVVQSKGVVWYPYDSTTTNHQKAFFHGAEGWIAYCKDGFIFIKKFPVIAAAKTAPGEENVEVYVNKQKTYIELENQGAYQPLQPNQSLKYEVIWYGRRLPAGMEVSVGNEKLLEFVRRVISKR